MESFPVDDCFGMGIGRAPLDGLAADLGRGANDLVTFEEFIRGSARNTTNNRTSEAQQQFENLRPIDEEEDQLADDFFDIALGTPRGVPEDPPAIRPNKTGGAGRSKNYVVGPNDFQNGHHQKQQNNNKNQNPFSSPAPATSFPTSSSSFRQSFCPTVGEGASIWLGAPRRRGSQESEAYGYEPPPEEPKPTRADHCDNPQQKYAVEGTPAAGSNNLREEEEGKHQIQSQQKEKRLLVLGRNSGGSLLLSRIFCCLRRVSGQQTRCGGGGGGGGTTRILGRIGGGERGEERGKRESEKGGGAGTTTNQQQKQQQQKLYSWDTRDELQNDPKEFLWQGLVGETRVKEPGQLAGNPFQIERCVDCTLVLLDQSASITIDDCRNCVILCGPCRGSVFVRDCANLLVLAICQQFRTRDCAQLCAHLFCTTCPTIEQTELEVAPLLLNYGGLQTQMHAAGISPFANRWNQVHNFTPDSGKCRVQQSAHPTAHSFNAKLVQQLRQFLANFSSSERWQLSIGNALESSIFVPRLGPKNFGGGEELQNGEERVLVLVQAKEGVDPGGIRFYAEAAAFVREFLALDRAKLAAMHDVDLRPGEWETIFRGGKGGQPQQKTTKMSIKKIVALEFHGPKGISQRMEGICRQPGKNVADARLEDFEHMENCRKQLYRLCEIRQSI